MIEFSLNIMQGEDLLDDKGILTYLYVQFVTATTIGYGEIYPRTYYGMIALMQTIILG